MRVVPLWLLALILGASPVQAEKAPPLKASYTAEQVAEDVYVIHGPLGVPSPENQGFMNNPAFVAQGAGEQWLEVMMEMTGGATAGTRVVGADTPVKDQTDIRVGEVTFRILHDGKAHTDNDIMILLPEKGVIFLGDNAGHGRMLRMNDGSFQGNIRALERALASGARVFVPGHGSSGGPEAATEYRDYLQTVLDGVKALFEEDLSDFEMKPRLLPKLARWKDWVDFDSLVGSHVSIAYLEVEAGAF